MRPSWSSDVIMLRLKSNYNTYNKILVNDYIGNALTNNLVNYYYSFVFSLRVLKLKLKGKTLRFKRLGSYFFYFKFGITHPSCSILHCGSYFKRKGKQKFSLFGYNKYTLLFTAKYFIYWKPSNLYHWRGIRLVRTFMRRKAGKVSEYR